MDDKLSLAIETIYSSLTTTWMDNGNINAEAVRDDVLTNLSTLTGKSIPGLEKEIEDRITEKQ
jgi:hypothetical protein